MLFTFCDLLEQFRMQDAWSHSKRLYCCWKTKVGCPHSHTVVHTKYIYHTKEVPRKVNLPPKIIYKEVTEEEHHKEVHLDCCSDGRAVAPSVRARDGSAPIFQNGGGLTENLDKPWQTEEEAPKIARTLKCCQSISMPRFGDMQVSLSPLAPVLSRTTFSIWGIWVGTSSALGAKLVRPASTDFLT